MPPRRTDPGALERTDKLYWRCDKGEGVMEIVALSSRLDTTLESPSFAVRCSTRHERIEISSTDRDFTDVSKIN